MYGRGLDFGSVMMIAVTVWLTVMPFVGYMIMTDHINITIENDYLYEYNECKIELERTQPICPACECSNNSSSMEWVLILMLCFIVGAVSFNIGKFIGEKKKPVKKTKSKKSGA